jgi:transposase
VSSTPRWRRLTAEYKLGILAAVEVARDAGGIGALLRREGLFSSHLTKWKACGHRARMLANSDGLGEETTS